MARKKAWRYRTVRRSSQDKRWWFFCFDGISADESTVAYFSCSRAKTGSGRENTGAVRKVLHDIIVLGKFKRTKRCIAVFTDQEFLALMERRASRHGTDGIKFLHCKLPSQLNMELEQVLNNARMEQKRDEATFE